MADERTRTMAVYTLLALLAGEMEVRRIRADLYAERRIEELRQRRGLEVGEFLYDNLHRGVRIREGDLYVVMAALWSYYQLWEDDSYLKTIRDNATDRRVVDEMTRLLKQLDAEWKTVRLGLENAIRTIRDARKKTEQIYPILRSRVPDLHEYWIRSIWG